jgi:hypothetical protein
VTPSIVDLVSTAPLCAELSEAVSITTEMSITARAILLYADSQAMETDPQPAQGLCFDSPGAPQLVDCFFWRASRAWDRYAGTTRRQFRQRSA